MSIKDLSSYDFIINDEDETMLLLYAQEEAPTNPVFDISFDTKSALLLRNENSGVELKDIPDNILDSLQDTDKLLVCELSAEEKEEDTKIIYAYEAEVRL